MAPPFPLVNIEDELCRSLPENKSGFSVSNHIQRGTDNYWAVIMNIRLF